MRWILNTGMWERWCGSFVRGRDFEIFSTCVTKIEPGPLQRRWRGAPDCHQCDCIASMGLAAVGHYKVLGPLTAGQIFTVSDRFGKGWRKLQNALSPKPVLAAEPAPFKIL